MPTTKVALIPGGAKGIGRAIGLALASRGWDVAFCWRTSANAAADTEARVRAAGRRALSIRADVSDPTAAAALVARTEAELGRVDALVHCAGFYARVGLLDETPEGWRATFGSNLDSLFYCARAAAPGMIARRWGRILGFSMANAEKLNAQPQLTAHYAAKVGVLVLIRSLARLLAPHGVTANAISPGFVDSGGAPADELRKMVKNIPAGYVGHVDDVVHAALYLLGDEARYVTGANLTVAGGWGL